MKSIKVLISLIAITLVLGILGFSYAYFTINILGTSSTSKVSIETGDFRLDFDDTEYVNMTNTIPGSTETKTFTVTNTGNVVNSYNVLWDNITNTLINRESLVYTITSDSGKNLPITVVPESGNNIEILSNISISPGQTQTFTMTITYENASYDQSSDMEKKFAGKLKIEECSYIHNNLVLHLNANNNTQNGFNSGATTWYNLAENGINAINDGAVNWTNDGAYFNGTSSAFHINDNTIIKPPEFTIELDLSFSSVVNNDRSIIFSKWPGYTIEFNANRTLSFGVVGGYLITPYALNLNTRYIITATYKDKVQNIYINGAYVGTQTITTNHNHSGSPLTIGRYGSGYYFNGYYKDIKLYNRALTADEVAFNVAKRL